MVSSVVKVTSSDVRGARGRRSEGGGRREVRSPTLHPLPTLPYHACADAVVHMRSVNPPLEQREGLREGESFAMRNIWRHEMNKFSWPEKGFMSQFTDTPPHNHPPTLPYLLSMSPHPTHPPPPSLFLIFVCAWWEFANFRLVFLRGCKGPLSSRGTEETKKGGPLERAQNARAGLIRARMRTGARARPALSLLLPAVSLHSFIIADAKLKLASRHHRHIC